MTAVATVPVRVPSQASPVEAMPPGPDLLRVRALLAGDDTSWGARAGLALVRRELGVGRDEAVRLIRAVVAAWPDDPVCGGYARILRVTDRVLTGGPAVHADPSDPLDPYGAHVDAAVEADYRSRGLYQ